MSAPDLAAPLSPFVESLLEDTVTDAVAYFKAGKPGRGEYELVRGALRVARLTGDMDSIHALADLRYYEISVPVPAQRAADPRLDEIGGAA